VDLSYCVVNTNGRELLLACLAAIRDHGPADVESEVLVADNASDDGSAAAVEAWNAGPEGIGDRLRLLRRDEREGKAALDSLLLGEARGELCLLLNEDSELRAGAVQALVDALRADPRAAAAGAQLIDPSGRPQPCAWRLPGPASALAGALFLHRQLVTESRGDRVREVGWVQSAAMLVRRRAAAAVGYFDPAFFVYSDETDFAKRLRDAGWRILYVPEAVAVHHEQLATDAAARSGRVVEFHRGRDRYLRPLLALPYAARALAATFLPGHDPRLYALHARQALRPGRGEGLREAARAYNAARSRRA
jgi:hypothetical protein